MGDIQPCSPCVRNHKKYQIQPCPGIQSLVRHYNMLDILLKEEFVSHEIATEYQPVEVEKFSSQGSDQPRLLESRNVFVVYISELYAQ